jgi:CSLREA domain-containing protein
MNRLTAHVCATRRLHWLTLSACLAFQPGLAQAQPVNDNYANRKIITSLPFEETEAAIGLATVEPTDPLIFCRQSGAGTGGNTVWYSYTTGPADQYVDFTTVNSTYDTILAFYTGGPGAFRLVSGGCNDNGIAATQRARLSGLRLRANTTYSIVVARQAQSATSVVLRVLVDVAPLYLVTKTTDSADGVCNADCSLREAISASNAMPGAVVVPAGTYLLTLPGVEDANAGGDLDVGAGMGIYGAGPTTTVVDAQDIDRVVDIAPGSVSVHLNGLTLTNGSTSGVGGGLHSPGDFLTLEDVAVTSNVSTNRGGGLVLDGYALLRRVTLSSNQTGVDGGGAHFDSTAKIEVYDSTINNNASLNPSAGGGGGIHTRAQLRLDQVTISGNTANFAGGGVLLGTSGVLTMRNTTITRNIADADNNDLSTGGGLFREGIADIANSVIANNRALGGLPSDLNDCRAQGGSETTTYNHVLRRDNCFFEGPGDAFNVDPQLSPTLASNGGSTATHAILPGSPLIDAGNPAGCLDGSGVPFPYDQRGPGFPRTVDGNDDTVAVCDKGAYEFMPGGPQPPNAPTNLVATRVHDTSAMLTWTDNSNNETAFKIERAPAASGPWANVGTLQPDMTIFEDTTLSPLTDYYYRVYAENAQGPSAPTTALLVHTTPVELQRFTVE